MTDDVNDGKRDFLRSAAVLGVAGGMLGSAMAPRQAIAQMLETGIREDSSLAKIRKEGVMRVGYSQTGPWFYKDAKTRRARRHLQGRGGAPARRRWRSRSTGRRSRSQNSTVGLRTGDYDLYGSSLTYTTARAVVVDYVGPLWSKGSLLMVHKDNADRFKRLADFDERDVTSRSSRARSEEPRIPMLFPKAKLITTTGQVDARRRAGASEARRRLDERRQRRASCSPSATTGRRCSIRRTRSTSGRTRGPCVTATTNGSSSSISGPRS